MFIQAVLIGVLCYLAALGVPWFIGTTGGFYYLSRPLVSGLFVGLILGDVQTGIIIGAAVQALYLSLIVPGGVAAADITFVAYPAIALAMLSGADPEIAVTLAATIGLLGVVVFNIMMTINVFWNHLSDKYLKERNLRGFNLANGIFPQITTFILRFVPTFVAVYFGAQHAEAFLNSFPTIVMDIMGVLGGVLPAVGIGLLLSHIMKENYLVVYFLIGFVAVVFLNLNMIALTIVGACIAMMHFKYSSAPVVATAGPADFDDDDEEVL